MSQAPSYKFIEGKRCIYHDGLAVVKHTCGDYLCKECIRDDAVCPSCGKAVNVERTKHQPPAKAPIHKPQAPAMETPPTPQPAALPPPPPPELPRLEAAPQVPKPLKVPPKESEEEEEVEEEEDVPDEPPRKRDFSRL